MLYNCPECKQPVSTDAMSCPHCGKTLVATVQQIRSKDPFEREKAMQITVERTKAVSEAYQRERLEKVRQEQARRNAAMRRQADTRAAEIEKRRHKRRMWISSIVGLLFGVPLFGLGMITLFLWISYINPNKTFFRSDNKAAKCFMLGMVVNMLILLAGAAVYFWRTYWSR